MKLTIICSLLCLSVIITGCFDGPDRKILIGKYCFNRSNLDSLFVNADGSYEHKLTAADGHVFKALGKWKYNSSSSELHFEDFTFFSDEFGAGNWYSKVRVTDDEEIQLMYSSEDDIYYSKK